MAEVRPCGSARVRDGSGEGGSQDARCTERGGGVRGVEGVDTEEDGGH